MGREIRIDLGVVRRASAARSLCTLFYLSSFLVFPFLSLRSVSPASDLPSPKGWIGLELSHEFSRRFLFCAHSTI
jgi:hypothetical protein